MTLEESQKLEEIAELTQQHKELSVRLEELIEGSTLGRKGATEIDQLEMSRIKKRKLRLKDQLAKLKSSLIPDQPA